MRINHGTPTYHALLFTAAFALLSRLPAFTSSAYQPETVDMINEKFTWTQFNDLAGLGAHCIAEDSSGNLWFGLENGIICYDGLNWTSYSQNNGLPPAFIQNLVTSPDGKMYAVYETSGVYVLQDSLWQPVPTIEGDSSVVFRDITFTGRDSLWVSTSRGAVFKHAENTRIYTPDTIYSNPSPLPADSSRPNSLCNIYRVYQDRNQNLWLVDISNFAGTLYLIKKWRKNIDNLSSWKKYSSSESGIELGTRSQIYHASDGTYWIYSYNEISGLLTFSDPDSPWDYINLTDHGGNNLVLSVAETDDHTMWFGGNGYLYRFRKGRFKTYTPHDLNVQIAPFELLQTKDGALWMLSLNAEVYRVDYSGKNWKIFPNLHYQCETSDGLAYFISADGRIISHGPHLSVWHQFSTKDGLMDMPIVVLSTRTDEIWAAGSDRGIAAVSRFDGAGWHTKKFPALSWSISYLSAMEAADGSLWFGSMGDPVNRFTGGCMVLHRTAGREQWHHIVSATESFNRIGMLTQTTDGTIWAGGSHLMYFDGEKFNLAEKPQELHKGWIDHLYAAKNGDLYAAKGGVGVFRKSGDNWTKYTLDDHIAGNMVTYLLETADHQMIVATQRGISRFDGRSWTEFCFPRQIKINRESGTLKQSMDGKIWINLAPRAWYFRATNRRSQLRKEFPGFRAISYSGDDLPPQTRILVFQQRLTKPANQYITWKGSDHWGVTAEEELSFSYRLDDGEWSVFSPATSVQFLNMQDGRHSFFVQARDNDGNIDPSPAAINFQVLPVIWKQTWFIGLILLFSSAIIVLLMSLVINNRKLAHANREIEKIASFKERFFLNISHEIRTPLTLLLAPISKMLSQKNTDPGSAKKQLDMMRHHGHYLLQIVNQLFNFRKLESGRYNLQVSNSDIVQFVRDVKSLFDPFAADHDMDYRLVTDTKNLNAWFDPEKIETILMNLIGNAIKFTPDGGRIEIRLTPKIIQRRDRPLWKKMILKALNKPDRKNTAGNNWIEIKVSDSGIGIPPSRTKHIFDRFYHVEHPGKLFYDSIGIGLDFTKEVVELHKGSIRVDSREGFGSTFTVVLPIDRSSYRQDEILPAFDGHILHTLPEQTLEEIKEGRRKIHSRDGRSDGQKTGDRSGTVDHKKHILIVEDHSDMRNLLADFLHDHYEISIAENGQRGIEMALEIVPDLVISDIMMPEMDGLQFTRKLKLNMVTSHIPVILLSVKNQLEYRIEGLEVGADAYVSKPFSYKELRLRIRNLLEIREQLKRRFSNDHQLTAAAAAVTLLDKEFMQKCQQSVEKHIGEQNFNVDILCREIGMSRTQAYRKVKNITGFSLNELIIHIKLRRALKLLSDSQLNISEIAYSLGFCDHAHFSRHFHKKFGCPPKEFRKRLLTIE